MVAQPVRRDAAERVHGPMATDGPDDLLAQLTGSKPADVALAAVLDALPDAIIAVDRDGRMRYSNLAAEHLTGYPREALVGRPVEELVPLDRRDAHRTSRLDFQRDPVPRPMGAMLDTRLLRADGQIIPADISLGPVTVHGETFVIAAIRDASARQETEDALRRALELEARASGELRNASRLRDSFLRALSHDLRTPLSVMLTVAMTLQEHLERLPADTIQELLERLRRNGARLERMLSDLMELDRSSHDGLQTPREKVDLVALVRQVLVELRDSAPDVHLDVPEQLLWQVAPAELRRILENLLLNATKYAPSKSPITVRLEVLDDTVVLTVEDRGPGVPDEDKERIFEPFVRGRTLDTAQGSGVGLSLVAAFARAHGGRAWVQDRSGGGASFRVSLPAPEQ